jgi:nitrogen-specific signal transduction histidine kinase
LKSTPRDRLQRITSEAAPSKQGNQMLVRGLAHEDQQLGGIRGAAQLLARELATKT